MLCQGRSWFPDTFPQKRTFSRRLKMYVVVCTVCEVPTSYMAAVISPNEKRKGVADMTFCSPMRWRAGCSCTSRGRPVFHRFCATWNHPSVRMYEPSCCDTAANTRAWLYLGCLGYQDCKLAVLHTPVLFKRCHDLHQPAPLNRSVPTQFYASYLRTAVV